MGLIRSGAIVVFSVVFFIAIFVSGIFLTLSWSLDYDSFKEGSGEVAKDFSKELGVQEIIEENLVAMEMYCKVYNSFTLEEEEFNLEIPCEIILQGSDAIVEYSVGEVLYDVYYKEYDCDFWECLRESNQPFVLVSAKAKHYWNAKAYLFLLLAVALAVLIFFVAHGKYKAPLILGGLMVLVSLPFRKMNWVLGFVPDNSFLDLVALFFTRSYNVFLYFIIIGIALLLLGLALRFLKLGIRVSKWFGKGEGEVEEKDLSKEDVKTIVKKEVKKQKKEDLGKGKVKSEKK